MGQRSRRRSCQSPDGVPAVAGDALPTASAAPPIQHQAAHRQRQLPVWTRHSHRASG